MIIGSLCVRVVHVVVGGMVLLTAAGIIWNITVGAVTQSRFKLDLLSKSPFDP